METTGETANLGVERDGRVLFLNQVETHAHIRAFFPPGTVSAMHASGIGKALLAAFDPARRNRILDAHPLERFTPHSLTDRAALCADLDRCAARGYAIDDEERNEGMRCIAVAVHDAQGEAVAGLSVSGPVARLAEAGLPRLVDAVREAAARLTVDIGSGAPRG
ncbi:IclR family transcriptional regulator [Limimaricola soesokkakensis]|uniref:IclR family transcriptional regulator n=1 Tax=Limimaricola soesokkakensis TaxID=1343159 RepID=UPI0035133374